MSQSSDPFIMKALYPTLLFLLFSCTAMTRPLIVAHRGASAEAPGNTIPAFELAWGQSADAIEGDFHLSQDSEIVCIHDRDTKRIAEQKLVVKDSNFEVLRALQFRKDFSKGHADLHIPSFAEVAHTVPEDGKFYIEIKSDSKILPHLEKALKRSNLRKEQIVLISFETKVIEAAKKADPDMKAVWLTSLKKTRKGQFEPSAAEVIRQLKELNADGVSVKAISELTKSYIQTIKAAGFEFHVWTVNTPEHAKQLAGYGVNSITTDYPGRILEAVKQGD
jgi:glycerophosphoryl diester phosphodiesterase